jgi:hypothetical protein
MNHDVALEVAITPRMRSDMRGGGGIERQFDRTVNPVPVTLTSGGDSGMTPDWLIFTARDPELARLAKRLFSALTAITHTTHNQLSH